MSYYIRVAETLNGPHVETWDIDEHAATRLGVPNPQQGPGSYFRAEPGEDIWDAIRRQASSWFEPNGACPFHKTALGPGEFYPRIARPMDHHPWEPPSYSPQAPSLKDVIAIAQG